MKIMGITVKTKMFIFTEVVVSNSPVGLGIYEHAHSGTESTLVEKLIRFGLDL